jgi:hypothetical protein
LLKASALDVQVCGDVYRGLARLGRGGTDAPKAVLVCADDLGSPELEFFSITSRLGCGAVVYVYGDGRSEARVARAIELGATGRADEQVIRTLGSAAPLPEPSASRDTGETVQVESTATGAERPETPTETGSPVESTVQTPAEVLPEPQKVEECEREVRESPVRVPWLRYGSTPERTPPQRHRSRSDQPAPVESSKRRPSVHEPLLTEEELQALIGDDIASIAPREHDANAGDADAEGTGGAR